MKALKLTRRQPYVEVVEARSWELLPAFDCGGYFDARFDPPRLRLADTIEALPDARWKVVRQWVAATFNPDLYDLRDTRKK